MIVDCHTHLSKLGREGNSFSEIRNILLAEMDRLNIDVAIVYPDSEPDTLLSDLETTRELVKDQSRLRMLGTVSIPPLGAEDFEGLDRLAADGSIAGVKLYPGFETFYPDDERCHRVYELCMKHKLPVVFHSGESMNEPWREKYNHPDEIAKVAGRFPSLVVVIAHFSQPHLSACSRVVTAYRNVHADISGLAHPDVVRACGHEAIAANLKNTVTRQPEKVLFGTDWPICKVETHLQLVADMPLSESSKQLVFSGNAERVFGLS